MNVSPPPIRKPRPARGSAYADIVKARAFDKIAADPDAAAAIVAATERRLAA